MHLFLRLLCIYCSFINPLVMAKAVYSLSSRTFNESTHLPDRNPAVRRLKEVFGVTDRQRQKQHLSPPQYMITLYESVADYNSGLVKAPNPYSAKVIRSYTEKETTRRNRFTFDVSGLGISEMLIEAELHLYVLKSDESLSYEVRVYQIFDSSWGGYAEKNRLIDVNVVDSSVEGWQIFRVTQALAPRLKNSDPIHIGFLVTAVSATGQPMLLHVSRRRDRHANHQPLLVLFNDDTSSVPVTQSDLLNKKDSNNFISKASSDVEKQRVEEIEPLVLRQRRDLTSTTHTHEPFQRVMTSHHHRRHLGHNNECHRQELYVDFESIGWSEWIIAPKGYNAYHCTGICSFPLGQSQRPTNHATVQSIVHEMNLVDSVAQPCCVPNRLLSLSLLYYDDSENVVLKHYSEMVADSCGCH